MKKRKIYVTNNREKGITLIALIITIVVLIIIAGITIGVLISDNGVMTKSMTAKNDTEISKEKEIVNLSASQAIAVEGENKLTQNGLQEQVNGYAQNNKPIEVLDNGDTFVVHFTDSGRYYEIDGKNPAKEFKPYVDTTPGVLAKNDSGAYLIESIEDLVELAKEANTDGSDYPKFNGKNIILVRDLDFNSRFSYADYTAKYSYVEEHNAYEPDESSTTTIKELCTTGQGFIPIGSKCPTYFGGIFCGEEQRELRNLYINRSDNAGLFDTCSGSHGTITIKNITITGEIICTGSGQAAGFIGGVNKGRNVILENCINKAKITNTGTGIAIGFSHGPFSGGKGNMTNCINYGDITAENGTAFGLLSTNSVTVKKCFNYGKIKGKTGAGGLVRKIF